MISPNDFEQMGICIERRFARCTDWWAPHLACTRDFVARYSQRASSVAVLGAGRLFDLDLQQLLTTCDVAHLFDADPGCVATWKRQAGDHFNKRVFPHIGDITQSLDGWTRGLSKARRAGELTEYLHSLMPTTIAPAAHYDGVISLNLLGQIPLYWRDRVRVAASEIDPVTWAALVSSMAALQEAHLNFVRQSASSWSMIISDTEYYFYDIDKTEWRVEPALFGDTERLWASSKGDPATIAKDSWLWHIAPQLIESDEEGEIHRVEARFYRYL
jgi:hypothetical protein